MLMTHCELNCGFVSSVCVEYLLNGVANSYALMRNIFLHISSDHLVNLLAIGFDNNRKGKII